MKTLKILAILALGGLALAETPAGQKLPFVYTKWKQFGLAEGLPNEHVFAVKSDGDRLWVGTEGGLALVDKKTQKVVKVWTEKEGLPWRAVTGIDINKKTGEVWLALFGGGLARLSGGRFDHWHQLNSGIVNDVAYGVAVENDNVWVATTAGASRFNTVTNEWTIYTEKNSPMEEIWNYGVHYAEGKVRLAVWGSGVLEFDVATERWKEYLDPDGEMEIDLYRDDGIVHVITTGVKYVDKIMWVSSYFGTCRYDGRNWRAYYNMDSGTPSDFTNNLAARSGNEAWFATDKGVGALMDAETNTWVTYTRDPKSKTGKAVVMRDKTVLETVEMGLNLPHNYSVSMDVDGNDVFIGTSKGLAWGMGDGYYAGVKERPRQMAEQRGGSHE